MLDDADADEEEQEQEEVETLLPEMLQLQRDEAQQLGMLESDGVPEEEEDGAPSPEVRRCA